MLKSVFFTTIALMIATAAGLQFFISYELNDQCGDGDVHTAPVVAGITLLSSFVFNAAWLMARRTKMKNVVRLSIFLWTTIITVGVAAAGAVLGQSELYDNVCAGQITTDVESVQYASIVLLVLAIASPHAFKTDKKNAKNETDEGGSPLTNDEERPLIL